MLGKAGRDKQRRPSHCSHCRENKNTGAGCAETVHIAPVRCPHSLQGEKTSLVLFGYYSLEAFFISAGHQVTFLQIPQQKVSVMRETCDLWALEESLHWKGTSSGKAGAGT